MPSSKVRRASSWSSLAAVAAFGASATTALHQSGRKNQRQLHQDVKLGVLTDPVTILEQDTKGFFESRSRSSSISEFPLPPPQLIEEDIQVKESPSKQPASNQLNIKDTKTNIKRAELEKELMEGIVKTSPGKKNRLIIPPNSRGGGVATMPGFKAKTQKELADKQSLNFIESTTGGQVDEITDALQREHKRSRRRGGHKMYKEAQSVPDSLIQFANELHQEQRISPREEIELGNLTQEAIRVQTLYDDLASKLCRDPTDDEWCAAAGKINIQALEQVMEEGLEAKNKLVTANLRMVQRVVNVYIQNGLSGQYNAGDMMQDGIMALIRAAEKFEPDRGFRFSTYAMYWIRSAVKRSQEFQSRVVPLPQRLHSNHKKVITTRHELQQVLGRPPTQAELAEAVEMTAAQLNRCVKANEQRFFSLDQQIYNSKTPNKAMERENTLLDVIDSRNHDDDIDGVSRKLLRQDLITTIYRHLDRECAHMLLLRFGFVDSKILPQGYEGPLTIAQVSEIVGMKPDKVRRRLIRSLEDLKYLLGQEWLDYERMFN
mmetsp:Transcript_12871/g.18912  ORF Transcript_12871/g.18912 Transcript_12871/m.18912 type:complete len:546 (-) Transcript_12871:38-1675(-)